MAHIQAVSTWYQGEQREATVFNIFGSYNSLFSFGSATFGYQLIEEIIIPKHEEIVDGIVVIIPEQINSQTLVTGEFSINDQDYEDWTNSTDSNIWIYNYAANKLNLTIITL